MIRTRQDKLGIYAAFPIPARMQLYFDAEKKKIRILWYNRKGKILQSKVIRLRGLRKPRARIWLGK